MYLTASREKSSAFSTPVDDLLETLTYWLSFAAVALSVIVVAAYVWHKAAEQKATRV